MHFCHNYNRETCNLHHKSSWQVYRHHTCFLPRLNRNRSLLYLDCMYVYYIQNHRPHHLTRLISIRRFRHDHNLQDHSHIQGSFISHHKKLHRQLGQLITLVRNSLANSHYSFRSSLWDLY